MNTKGSYLKLIQICLLLLVALTALSQNDTYDRKLSVSEWIKEMMNCQDSVYVLQNAQIIYDEEKDDSFFEKYEEEATEIIINSEVYILQCIFPSYDGWLSNIKFKHIIYFETCKGDELAFSDCTFETRIIIINSEFGTIQFVDSKIKGGLHIGDHNKIKEIFFDNIVFEANWDRNTSFFTIYSTALVYIGIKNSKFILCDSLKNLPLETSMTPIIEIEATTENLYLTDNTFDLPVSFDELIVSDNLDVEHCTFNNFVNIKAINFPENNTNFDWKMLTNKLCVFVENEEDTLDVYLGKTDVELENTYIHKELVAGYNKFFKMYRNRGDLESANACYVEMKELETQRLKYSFNKDPTLTNFFQLRLNQFLKYFCEYGTSPARSLIISMYIILAFSILYFFFYSEWDRINRTFLIRQYQKIQKYFRSEQKLEDFYSEEHKEEFQSYKEFEKELEESKIEVPFFFSVLGKPLYHFSLVRHKIMTLLYRRTEILSGRWTDLKSIRKIYVGSTVGLAITIYLIYLVFVRVLNSIILSINTFSTLGFGDIPVKGFTRYVAILEGFLGWFLLSIFSVSLISQILQN